MVESGNNSQPQLNLPLHSSWKTEDEYVQSLLTFITTSSLFRNLCGGVHILDFLTRQPDLYTTVLPQEWRDWFDLVDIEDVLEVLLRLDVEEIRAAQREERFVTETGKKLSCPPNSLLDYVDTIRKHCLRREYVPDANTKIHDLPRHVAVGMKPKKNHEVANFAAYVNDLTSRVSDKLGEPLSLVDFGSGQNYLGRTLASPPYNKHVIAIERKHHNVQGARGMDVLAGLAKKQKVMRNKKDYKKKLETIQDNGGILTPPPEAVNQVENSLPVPEVVLDDVVDSNEEVDLTKGSMTYIEHNIDDGQLEHILYPIDASDPANPAIPEIKTTTTSTSPNPPRPKVMTISLHSCGNLSHHGIRSLTLNPSVSAIAIIGCCYNLLTERLGPPTYKLPQLRPNHPRLEATGNARDPNGFPMSKTLEQSSPPTSSPTQPHHDTHEYEREHEREREHEPGIRLNITARMMAVQAPYNWGPIDSEMFFRRHFYRALLQRILLDRGVVKQASSPDDVVIGGNSLSGKDTQGTPLIIGTLRKDCFGSFKKYVRGALRKLTTVVPDDGGNDGGGGGENGRAREEQEKEKAMEREEKKKEAEFVLEKTWDLLDEENEDGRREIERYERDWGYAKKNLAVIWSLMAFSAGVVESTIAVDRWLYLKEQDCVESAWVETVFDYTLSPRNLCVVGIKKHG